MAFRGRGSLASTGSKSNSKSRGFIAHHRFRYRYYYNPYIEIIGLIFAFILIVGSIISYIYSYEIKVYDPIFTFKKIYLTIQMLCILTTMILNVIFGFLIENTSKTITFLETLLIISGILFFSLFVCKLYFDFTCTSDTFEKTYEHIYIEQTNENFGENVDKLVFINENIKAYNYFSIKVYINMILQFASILFTAFVLLKNIKQKQKEDYIKKENEVLFDEEINVKI